MNAERSSIVSLKSREQAEHYHQNGNFGRSFAHFLVALKLNPTLKTDLKDLFASVLDTWSNQLETSDRFADLFNCYEQALQVFPENELLYRNLAHVLLSCDIHPDGLRFATGGQGKDSGSVAIWNMNAIIDPVTEKDTNIPKLLCQLDNHLSCVNCVRWSHSGLYLASGSDDKLIMIWKMAGETVINSENIITEVERWRCVGTLTGHMNDVLDLAWAPHDTWLASCSVDNTVIVWNIEKIPEVVTRLTGHASLVKGVTWDPVGQYLASQSDDKTLRIWRVSDWGEQVCITEPFQDCGNITHVLRLHWSPDGQALVSAHAMNNGGPTAKIIEIIDRPITSDKYSWSCEMDFVGHRKAVTCVRFNNNLLSKNGKKHCVLATGSRDCSVAVWCTNRRRPLVVIKNIFTKAVLDFSWSKDGMRLLACSWDGSIAIIVFSEEELGTVLSEDEKTTALEALYGKSYALKHLGNAKILPVMETPIQSLEEKSEPMEVSTETDKSQPPVVNNSEKTNAEPVIQVNGCESHPEPLKPPSTPQPVEVKPVEDAVVVKQFEMRTADGKRRITPITLSRSPTGGEKGNTFSTSCDSKTKIVVEKVGDGNNEEPAAKNEEKKSVAAPIAVKRKIAEPPQSIAARAVKRQCILPVSIPSVDVSAPSPPLPRATPMSEPDHVLESLSVFATSGLAVQGQPDSLISIENNKPGHCSVIRRKDRRDGSVNVRWSLALSDQIIGIRSNSSVTVVCCKDSLMYSIDSSSGFYLCPPIRLSGLPACLVLILDKACVVTTRGHLTLWNLVAGTAIVQDQTLKFLLTDRGKSESVVSVRLAESGSPIVVLSNGSTYCLTKDWGWSVISDVNSLVYRESMQNSMIRAAIMQQDNRLPLKTALRTATGFMANIGSPKTDGKGTSLDVSAASFLIHQLGSALVVKSAAEYKYLLLALVRLYVEQDNLVQLRTIMLDLLEESKVMPISNAVTSLNLPKKALLAECLLLLKKNASCERLYQELNEIYERNFVKKEVVNGFGGAEEGAQRPSSPFSIL